jgi:hypothetical protein
MSQTSGLATYKLINCVISSFVDNFRDAIYAAACRLIAATLISLV